MKSRLLNYVPLSLLDKITPEDRKDQIIRVRAKRQLLKDIKSGVHKMKLFQKIAASDYFEKPHEERRRAIYDLFFELEEEYLQQIKEHWSTPYG